jgi:hypothetical protein
MSQILLEGGAEVKREEGDARECWREISHVLNAVKGGLLGTLIKGSLPGVVSENVVEVGQIRIELRGSGWPKDSGCKSGPHAKIVISPSIGEHRSVARS